MKILLFLFADCIAVLVVALIKLYHKVQEKEQLNEEIKFQNLEAEQIKNKLSQEINNKRIELGQIKKATQDQSETIKSLHEVEKQMRKEAENRAEEAYQTRVSALEVQYQNEAEAIKKQLKTVFDHGSKKIADQEEKLLELKAKQEAYIKAQQRQLEMETKKDFYRLNIDENDKSDIALLREMQNRFVKKEAIDKLIWEVYFKKPYDALMSRLSLDSSKKCGIYKITNLTTGQAYVGQSTDIKERARTHIKNALSSAPASNKLYQAMKKYGPEDFTFEILEEVPRDKLNERESFWISFYDCVARGLNSQKGSS